MRFETREPRDVARDLQRAPALDGRLGPAREGDDAPLDTHVEVVYPEPLVAPQLVQHIALKFRVRPLRKNPRQPALECGMRIAD
jgi:hypothetical protein